MEMGTRIAAGTVSKVETSPFNAGMVREDQEWSDARTLWIGAILSRIAAGSDDVSSNPLLSV
jgi:hypothetical protein